MKKPDAAKQLIKLQVKPMIIKLVNFFLRSKKMLNRREAE